MRKLLLVLVVVVAGFASKDWLTSLWWRSQPTQDLVGRYVRVFEGRRVQEFVLEPGGKGTFNLYGGADTPYASFGVSYNFDGTTLRAESERGVQVLTVEGDELHGSFEGGVTGETYDLVYVKQ